MEKKTYEIVVFDNQSRSSTYGQGAALADEECKIKQHRDWHISSQHRICLTAQMNNLLQTKQ